MPYIPPDPELGDKLDASFGPLVEDPPARPPLLKPNILSGAVRSVQDEGIRLAQLEVRNVDTQLAAFQAQLPLIRASETARVTPKDGKPGYSYDYAGLDIVSPPVLRLLGSLGLAWVTRPTVIPGNGFGLVYELRHGESGTSIEGVWPLGTDTRNPQAAGSAITYARRYALMAVTGVFPGGEDDDGAAATAEHARRQTSGRQRDEEMPALRESVRRAQEKAPKAPTPGAEENLAAFTAAREALKKLAADPSIPDEDELLAAAKTLDAAPTLGVDAGPGFSGSLRQVWVGLLAEMAGLAPDDPYLITLAKAANGTGCLDDVKDRLAARRADLAARTVAQAFDAPYLAGDDDA